MEEVQPFRGHWDFVRTHAPWRTEKAIRLGNFWPDDVRDNFLLWLSGAARGWLRAWRGGFLLTDRVAPDLSRPHRGDIWLRLLER